MKYLIPLLILFVTIAGYPFESKLTLIRSIGDDEHEEYTFFFLADAVISNKKEIFVVDPKGVCITKYNWDGTFVKRTGKKGKGPNDYIFPNRIQSFENRLYILDWRNFRIASVNTDLEDFKSISFRYLEYKNNWLKEWPNDFVVLDNERFLGFFPLYKKERGQMFIFNSHGKVEKIFFNDAPSEESNLKETFKHIFLSKVSSGVNYKTGRILVTFAFPGNPIDFFLFSLKGDLLTKFSFKQEKNFEFPAELLKHKVEKGVKVDFSMIDSIHSFENYFLVFLIEVRGAEEMGHSLEKKMEYFCLFFDKAGNFIYKEKLDESIHVLHVSPDGYILAKLSNPEDDVEKLLIYKLNIHK